MYPASIEDYVAPTSVDEALALIERYGEDAKVIAGGQSLIPMMKLRFVRPRCLIDLNRLDGQDGQGLKSTRITGHDLEVGALVCYASLIEDPLVAARLPVLAAVARGVADLQVRNWGTLGGSFAHADHAADYPPVALALEATFEARSSSGARTVPADDFFIGPLQTALRADEILTAIRFPLPPANAAAAYVKHSAVAGDFAIANACTSIETDSGGSVTAARVAVGGVLPRPALAASAAEALVNGAAPEAAGKAAAEDVPSFSDIRASAEFRSVLIGAAVTESARAAIEAARGEAASGT